MEIRKKCYPTYFKQVAAGNKTFEYRLADWEAHVGDSLILEEWDPETKNYTGQAVTKTIGYVLNLKDVPALHTEEEINKNGFMVISLKE